MWTMIWLSNNSALVCFLLGTRFVFPQIRKQETMLTVVNKRKGVVSWIYDVIG